MRKIPFAGIELTSQRVRGLRGTSELPGRPLHIYTVYIKKPQEDQLIENSQFPHTCTCSTVYWGDEYRVEYRTVLFVMYVWSSHIVSIDQPVRLSVLLVVS